MLLRDTRDENNLFEFVTSQKTSQKHVSNCVVRDYHCRVLRKNWFYSSHTRSLLRKQIHQLGSGHQTFHAIILFHVETFTAIHATEL